MKNLTYKQICKLHSRSARSISEIAVYACPILRNFDPQNLYCFGLINDCLESAALGKCFVRLDWSTFVVFCSCDEWPPLEAEIANIFEAEGMKNPFVYEKKDLAGCQSTEDVVQELQFRFEQS